MNETEKPLEEDIFNPQSRDNFVEGPFIGTITKTSNVSVESNTPAAIQQNPLYATFLGSDSDEYGYAIAVDAEGATYVTGYTTSLDFPATPGAFSTSRNGLLDVFIAKVNQFGNNLNYATFLGGSSDETSYDIAVDISGAAYVTGDVYSTDFPTTLGAFDTSHNGGYYDGFVVKINPTGNSLEYSSYLGGNGEDKNHGIAVDENGTTYVTGETYSSNFPITAGAFATTRPGGYDAYIVKINPSGGSLDYSTYLGGTQHEIGEKIAVGGDGSAYVTGSTGSLDFPVTSNAFDVSFNNIYDGFITKLDATGSSLVYSAFLGGGEDDSGMNIVVDTTGSAYITGFTKSADFLSFTPGAFDPFYNGLYDGFIAKVNPSGEKLDYWTFLGGSSDDKGFGIAVDDVGAIYVTGTTHSINLYPNIFDNVYKNIGDAFVVKLNSNGDILEYGTYLGGASYDDGFDIVIDTNRLAYITGRTASGDFPVTADAFQAYNNGSNDIFVVKLAAGDKPIQYDVDIADYFYYEYADADSFGGVYPNNQTIVKSCVNNIGIESVYGQVILKEKTGGKVIGSEWYRTSTDPLLPGEDTCVRFLWSHDGLYGSLENQELEAEATIEDHIDEMPENNTYSEVISISWSDFLMKEESYNYANPDTLAK